MKHPDGVSNARASTPSMPCAGPGLPTDAALPVRSATRWVKKWKGSQTGNRCPPFCNGRPGRLVAKQVEDQVPEKGALAGAWVPMVGWHELAGDLPDALVELFEPVDVTADPSGDVAG